MSDRIIRSALDMTCVTHQTTGLWRHPRNRADEYHTLKYWTDLAKLLERGTFDTLFIADVVGLYDVYRGSAEAALTDAAQVPVSRLRRAIMRRPAAGEWHAPRRCG